MECEFKNIKYSDKYPAKIIIQNDKDIITYEELHWHKTYELIYLIDGSLNVKINGDITTLLSGDVLFINSDCFHHILNSDSDNGTEYLTVLLSYEQLLKYCEKLPESEFTLDKNESAKLRITELLKQIYVLHKEKTIGYEIKINSLIYDIYYVLVSDCMVESTIKTQVLSKKELKYVKKAMEIIQQRYQERINLGEIATEVGVSIPYLARFFKLFAQQSVMQYMSKIRLDSALRDMIEENKSVTGAAFDNGFANVGAFIITCKKEYNCTPRQYKNKMSK